MVNGYVINVGNGSVKQWISFGYEFTLNGMSNAEIGIDGVDGVYDSEFDVDKEINIYKNGVLKFTGSVIEKNNLTGGGVVLTAMGVEIELADNKVPIVSGVSRVWTSTSDNTIFSTLVTSVSGWTVDVSNSSSVVVSSFRVTATESVWNSVIRLIEQTGKDIRVDQANKKVYLYDELTSTSDTFSFIEGQNAQGISRVKSRSKAGKVLVYGKCAV